MTRSSTPPPDERLAELLRLHEAVLNAPHDLLISSGEAEGPTRAERETAFRDALIASLRPSAPEDLPAGRRRSAGGGGRVMTNHAPTREGPAAMTLTDVDTSDEQCALVCMIVSNPGDGERPLAWQKRVNDLIRALRDERNAFRLALALERGEGDQP